MLLCVDLRIGWRVTKQKTPDKLAAEPEKDHVGQRVTESHKPLAQPADGGAPAPASGGDSASRSQLHGDGGRAGGRGMAAGTTRPPHLASLSKVFSGWHDEEKELLAHASKKE